MIRERNHIRLIGYTLMAWRNRRFQYSLRALFLVTTVAACGLGWWCRHFEVETIDDTPSRMRALVQHRGPWPDSYRREVRTMRRTGWNEILQDGPTYVYGRVGNRLEEQNWSYGVKHGIWREWNADGKLVTEGAFDDGKEHGKWCEWDYQVGGLRKEKVYDHGEVVDESDYAGSKDEFVERKTFTNRKPIFELSTGIDPETKEFYRSERQFKYDEQGGHSTTTVWIGKTKVAEYHRWNERAHGSSLAWYPTGQKKSEELWQNGLRDSDWKFWDISGTLLYKMQFDSGHLVNFNGEEVQNPFTRHPSFPDAQRSLFASVDNLQGWTWKLDLHASLFQALCRVSDISEEVMKVDRNALQAADISLDEPVTVSFPAGFPRVAAMQTFLDQHKLTCIVRYGEYCITTPKDSQEWKDPTGIYRLKPERSSKLWLYLERDTSASFDESLSEVIDKHFDEQRTGGKSIVRVKLDRAAFAATNRNPDSGRIRYMSKNVRIRDALGGLLYLSDCCCALEDDVLVIRPQPSKTAPPSPTATD